MSSMVFALSEKEREGAGVTVTNSTPETNKYPRVTVRLTGELGDVMRDLERATLASSPSEVVRRAIIVYHTLVAEKIKGSDVYVEKEDGRKIPIFL